MCQAKPGRRCKADTFKRLEVARARYTNPPERLRGLELGKAKVEFMLASADCAATFKEQNPELHAAANRIRDEQVALMPIKPAPDSPGHTEYLALAGARDRLATALTATHHAELSKTDVELAQMIYEDAVADVRASEMAFRAAAWWQYDIAGAAQAELRQAEAHGDADATEKARAVRYLVGHPSWPGDVDLRARAARATGDRALIDAVARERALAAHASAQVVRLAQAVSPHEVLERGVVVPPAPWTGRGRPAGPTDTPVVRYLCHGTTQNVRWSVKEACVFVTMSDKVAQQRLWAYGFHTVETSYPGVIRVVRAPDLTAYRGQVAIGGRGSVSA